MELDFYTLPESDGTPLVEPSYPDESKTAIVQDDFIFVVSHSQVEETLEMPLFIASIDR